MSVFVMTTAFLGLVLPMSVFLAHKEGYRQGRSQLIKTLGLKSDFSPYKNFNKIEPGDRVEWVKNHFGETEWWTVKSRTEKDLYLVDLNTGSMNAAVPASCVRTHRPIEWFDEYPRYDVVEAAKVAGLLAS